MREPVAELCYKCGQFAYTPTWMLFFIQISSAIPLYLGMLNAH